MTLANGLVRAGKIAGLAASASLTTIAAAQDNENTSENATAIPADEADAPAYGDIVVTAQRRSETLQKVPVSIAAFDNASLKSQNATDIQNVSLLVPGTQISTAEGKVIVAIRGISTNSIIGVAEGSVASHVDGFYVSRTSALIGSLLDVERVEVLKGPQGTLYGRNATAGTINVLNKKPSNELEVEMSLEGLLIDDTGTGNGTGLRGSFVGNFPISDNVRTRFSIMKNDRDGYMTGIYPGGEEIDLADADELYLRAQLEFDFGDDVTWLLASDNYSANDRGYFILMTGQARPDIEIAGARDGFDFIENSRRIFQDKPVGNQPKTNAITSTLEWRADDQITLKSLTQYRYNRYFNFGEFDSTQAPISEYVYRAPTKLFTQELQVNLEADQIRGVGGLYYYDESIDLFQFFDVFATLPGGTLDLNGSAKTKAYAIFGDLTYALSDTLDITVGGRFTHEKRSGTQDASFDLGALTLLANVADVDPVTFDAFTPKVVLNYQPTDDLTFYASAQKGFKGGGFNIGSLTDNTPYDPEKINAFEVGAKTRFLDGRLALNAAAFYYDYKNLQVEVTQSIETVVSNAAKARIKGIEVDGLAQPVDNLRLNFAFSIFDGEVVSDNLIVNPLFSLTPVSIEGNRLPRSSKFSASGGFAYDIDLESGATITPSFTASYRGQQFLTIFNDELISQDAFWWLRFSVGYESPGGNWGLSLFGDNLTNEYVLNSANPSAEGYGYGRQSSVAPPRTFGLRFDWRL